MARPNRTVANEAEPTFSVVIPAYQAAHLIERAIDSVLAQTQPPREIIVVDDGSTDDLSVVIDKYQHTVTYLTQSHRGVAAARNTGFAHATGDFISVCDADDAYSPELLEAWAGLAARRPDLDILCCGSTVEVNGANIKSTHTRSFITTNQRVGILAHNFIPGRSAVRKRYWDLVGGFDEALTVAEDWDFWIRTVLRGARAGLVDRPLAVTRLRPESISASPLGASRGRVAVLAKAMTRDDLTEVEREVVWAHFGEELVRMRLAEAHSALAKDSPHSRRRCLEIVMSPGHDIRSRAKAMAASALPLQVAKRVRKRAALDYRIPRA